MLEYLTVHIPYHLYAPYDDVYVILRVIFSYSDSKILSRVLYMIFVGVSRIDDYYFFLRRSLVQLFVRYTIHLCL